MAGPGARHVLDWTQRIEKGEVRSAARPTGMERNAVLTVYDWANGHQIHDEISSDRRNPTINANGRIYGASSATGTIPWLDPVKHEAGEIQLPATTAARTT